MGTPAVVIDEAVRAGPVHAPAFRWTERPAAVHHERTRVPVSAGRKHQQTARSRRKGHHTTSAMTLGQQFVPIETHRSKDDVAPGEGHAGHIEAMQSVNRAAPAHHEMPAAVAQGTNGFGHNIGGRVGPQAGQQ